MYNEQRAEAHALQKAAKDLTGREASDLFTQAAKTFLRLDTPDMKLKAAKCYAQAKDFEKAAKVYQDGNEPKLAAQCFVKCGRSLDAVQQFEKAGEPGEGLNVILDSKLFSQEKHDTLCKRLLDLVDEHVKNIWLGKITKQLSRASDAVLKRKFLLMVSSTDAKRTIFKEEGEWEMLVDLEVQDGNHYVAGGLCASWGQYADASRHFEKCDAREQALEIGLVAARMEVPVGCRYESNLPPQNKDLQTILQQLKQLRGLIGDGDKRGSSARPQEWEDEIAVLEVLASSASVEALEAQLIKVQLGPICDVRAKLRVWLTQRLFVYSMREAQGLDKPSHAARFLSSRSGIVPVKQHLDDANEGLVSRDELAMSHGWHTWRAAERACARLLTEYSNYASVRNCDHHIFRLF